MASEISLIKTDVDYNRDGFQTGTLRLPYSHDRSAYGQIPIPVVVLKNGTGPTVLLTGGNHGDEYEGPIGLMKLIQRMPEMKIQGRMIVIPALNFPAFINGTRTSPIDGGNLNRVFPGLRNGRQTEMIAHYVESELVPLADVIIDLHAGGASFNHYPTLLVDFPEDEIRRRRYKQLVDAFASPFTMIMDLLGEDRTFSAAAERGKKLFMYGEFGGCSSCTLEGLAVVENGVIRVLQTLGVVEKNEADFANLKPTRKLKVEGAQHYLYAPRAGVFEPTFRLGEDVKKGQVAGRLFDPYAPWQPPLELRFSGEGVIVCARTFAGVDAGDCIALMASGATWD